MFACHHGQFPTWLTQKLPLVWKNVAAQESQEENLHGNGICSREAILKTVPSPWDCDPRNCSDSSVGSGSTDLEK